MDVPRRTSTQRAAEALPGRALLVGQSDRTAEVGEGSGWGTHPELVLPAFAPEVRSHLASSWAEAAAASHGGVASYARLIQHLVAHGAPADFVIEATRALWDATHHARLTLGIASVYAGTELTFGPLDLDGANGPTVTVAETVDLVVREGCVGETIATAQLAVARDYAQAVAVRQVLARMADDSERHVAQSWRLLKWLVSQWPEQRARLLPSCEAASADAPTPRKDPMAEVLRRNGRLPAEEAHRIARNTVGRTVRPALQALAEGTSTSTPVTPNIRSSG